MDANQSRDAKAPRNSSMLMELMETICISLVIVIFVLIFVCRIVEVDGDSMEPTLWNRERLIAMTTLYKLEQNDIIVAKRADEPPIVKRVIAMGGQEVDIDFEKGIVYVDGVEQIEPFIKEPTRDDAGILGITYPVYVPEGYVFVLGDNRNESRDSRYQDIGLISEENILGEVKYRIFPLDKWGSVS